MKLWAKETGRVYDDGIVRKDYNNNSIEFLPWMYAKGLIEDIDYIELHTGDYFDTGLKVWAGCNEVKDE